MVELSNDVSIIPDPTSVGQAIVSLNANSSTREKNRKIGWTVDAWLSTEAAKRSTAVLYAHPGGKTWWG